MENGPNDTKKIGAIEIEPNEINNKGTKNMCEYYGK